MFVTYIFVTQLKHTIINLKLLYHVTNYLIVPNNEIEKKKINAATWQIACSWLGSCRLNLSDELKHFWGFVFWWVGGGGSSSGVGLKWMPITVGQRHK